MKYEFFHVLALDPVKGTEQLNRFLQKHPIHSIERQFVADGTNSFWSICVVILENENALTKPADSKRAKVDYQAELSPEHFSVFVRLREIRNEIASQQSIPPYAVFTNEQLAQMSQLEKLNLETLSQIKGIGGKRLKTYAVNLLNLLNDNTGANRA